MRSIFNFKEFSIMESKFQLSDVLLDKLSKIDSIISDKLLSIDSDDDYNTIDINKVDVNSDMDYKFITNQRDKGDSQDLKIGKFVSKLLRNKNIEYKDSDLEDFVNKYKASFDRKDFIHINGEDIRKYYHKSKNCEGKGHLQNSCMNDDTSQDLLDLYTETKECTLIIRKDENGKIKDRAILWEVKNKDGDDLGFLLDRVYFTTEKDKEVYYNYAKENGWMISTKVGNSESVREVRLNGKLITDELVVPIKKFNKFPSMDTMWVHIENGEYYLSTKKEGSIIEHDSNLDKVHDIDSILDVDIEDTCNNCFGLGCDICGDYEDEYQI